MALSATVQWDVRTTGSDANGGCFDPGVTYPGTDYSQQDAPQVAFTDLAIGSTTTQLSSAANPFTSAHVGNCINIVSGTGFTAGRYVVESVSGSVATMDRAVGTASSTGGIGNLGGSMLTIAAADAGTSSGNTLNIKAGTYTLTASVNIAQSTITYIGYQTTHNDNGTKPLITTSTDSTYLLNTGASNNGVQTFINLSFSTGAATVGGCIWQLSGHGSNQYWAFNSCKFSGFGNSGAIDSSDLTPYDVHAIYVTACEFENISTQAIRASGNVSIVSVTGSYFHGNSQDVSWGGSGTLTLIGNIFYGATGGSVILNDQAVTIYGNIWYGITGGYAVSPSSGTVVHSFSMNVLYDYSSDFEYAGAGTTNISSAAFASGTNAYGGTGSRLWPTASADITLTADPFVNASAGNFTLNASVGGGAALAGQGWPKAFGSGTANAPTPGAVQVQRLIARLLREGRQPKTIRNLWGSISLIWQAALAQKYVDAVLPKPKLPKLLKRKPRFFTLSDVAAVLATTNEQGQQRAFYWLLAETGLRAGEISGLRVEDVLLDRITVEQSVWGGKEQSPKSQSAVRTIAISPQLAELLWRQVARQKLAGHTFLFTVSTGNAFDMNVERARRLHPTLEDLELPKAGFHAFRHFNVSPHGCSKDSPQNHSGENRTRSHRQFHAGCLWSHSGVVRQ